MPEKPSNHVAPPLQLPPLQIPGNSGDNSGHGELVDGPRGGKLRRGGKPGNKGGRPPNEFKARMRELATKREHERYLESCLKGEHGPKVYLAALAYVTEHGYGKAAQPITGEGGVGPLEVQVTRRIVKADAG